MSAAAGIDDAPRMEPPTGTAPATTARKMAPAFSMHESGVFVSDDSEEAGASDDDEAAGRILEAADPVEVVGAPSRLEAAGWRPVTDDRTTICYGRIIDGVPRIDGPEELAAALLRMPYRSW